MKKRLLSLAMAVLMLFSLFPFTAAAAEPSGGSCGANVTWELDENGLLTIRGEGPMTDYSWGASPFYNRTDIQRVVIEPGVTTIGGYAFLRCANLSSVTIPEGVTRIGAYNFEENLSLESIAIPSTVEWIGLAAFRDCSNLKRVDVADLGAWCSIDFYDYSANPLCNGASLYQNGSVVSNLRLPESAAEVGTYAFYNCGSLTGVTVPEGVRAIGEKAFYSCDNLSSVTMADSVESIGVAAFYDCGLTSVAIPAGVTAIENSVFCDCSRLQSVTIPDGVTSIGLQSFGWCSALRTISLPDSVTTISNSAFQSCTGLTGIAIPNGVSRIERFTFDACSSLKNVTLPESLTYIGEDAFQNCSALTSVTIPDGVTVIDRAAFLSCYGLRTVTIPASVTTIGESAFYNDNQITDVYYGGTESAWAQISIGGSNTPLYNAEKHFTGPVVVDSGTCGENLTWELDSDGLLTIRGEGEMTSHPWDHASVKTVVIESGVTSIPEYAFQSCANLESITIPESVKQIKWNAFDGCGSLADVWYAGARIDWIDIEINGGNSPLLEARLHCAKPLYVVDSGACGEHVSWVLDSDCVLTIRGEGPMTDYTSEGHSPFYEHRNQILTVNIEPGVTSIGDYAFHECNRMQSVAIPDGVTRIGLGAFEYCRSLANVTLPDSISIIDMNAFVATCITCITIPNGVTELKFGLFQNCDKLTNVVIPDSVTVLGGALFHGCSSLKSVTIPPSVTEIEWQVFSNCYSLESVVIPEGVTRIEYGTFMQCRNLKNVQIPDSVTWIGESVFEGCTNLQSLNIPSGVTEIGTGAFQGCAALTELALPERLTSLGPRAFSGCSSLTSIAIPSGVTEIGDQTFQNCAALQSAEIPATVTRIGQSAFAGCAALTEITTYGSIGENAFKNCAALREAHVLDCRTIGGSAFSGCTALETVYLPDALTSVAAYAFNGAEALRDVWYDDAQSEWDQIDIAVLGNSALLNAALHVAELDHEHDWSDWTVVTPATRDAEGLQERVCSVCGRTRTRVTPRLDYIVSNPNWVYDFEDEPAVFRIETRGENLTYQWQISTDNGLTWENLDCTEPVYECVLTAEMHNARLRCVVTDSFGSSIASDFAYISIKQPMRLISGPQDAFGRVGGEVRFSVNVEGWVSSYKWYCSKNGGLTWKKVSEGSSLDVTITDASCDGWLYRCVLKDIYGSVISTGAARLTVIPALTITQQPQDYEGPVGSTATFTVAAEGEGLTYRWQYRDVGGAWTNSSFKAATMSCKVTADRDGREYRCVIRDAYENRVISEPAKITALEPMTITQQPQDYEGLVGSTATFTVAATGDGLTYRWQYKDVGGTWLNSSFKSPTMSCKLTAARDGRQYRCVITDAYGMKLTSAAVTMKILAGPTITQQPQDFTGQVGETATFSVAATGVGLKYQWEYKDVGGSWAPSSFKTATMSCRITAARDGRQYRCIVTDEYDRSVTSAPAAIIVAP